MGRDAIAGNLGVRGSPLRELLGAGIAVAAAAASGVSIKRVMGYGLDRADAVRKLAALDDAEQIP
jgi:hypothetical protein